jgi:alkylation response protein AidB-like acyl-CoA dehydrogenase
VDFSLSEAAEAVRDLADRMFGDRATVERVRQVERGTDRVDRDLWAELGGAGLLGVLVPEEVGGAGLGVVELCLLLEQQGRRVAPVPLLWHALAAGALARFGTVPGPEGDVLTVALAEWGDADPRRTSVRAVEDGDGWRLEGSKPVVPAAHLASRILVPATTGRGDVVVAVVDPQGPGVDLVRGEATTREVVSELVLSAAPAERLGGAEVLDWLVPRALLGVCALQLGVAEEALRLTAEYTSQREQFGRPLSTNQGVALRAADAYIDVEAMRVTTLLAAWRLDRDGEAPAEVEVAKWWASEGGNRVVHATQHLHGGMGADVDYPIHRYFLWGKQLENTLGGSSAWLARLGARLAEVHR